MSATISCVCPTHGRAWIIGEAIESYLRQEPCGVETELFILNDCAEQPLICDAPGVRIINLPQAVTDIRRKFDLAVKYAEGDWIAWWEDDDISLPWRLRLSVERGVNKGTNYKQRNAWYWNAGRFDKMDENLFIGSTLFKSADYLSSGGSQGEHGYPDQNMIHNFRTKCSITEELAAPQDAFFVYRWAGMGAHDSGFGGGVMLNPELRFQAFHAATLAHPLFKAGPQVIAPSWKDDYAVKSKKAIEVMGLK